MCLLNFLVVKVIYLFPLYSLLLIFFLNKNIILKKLINYFRRETVHTYVCIHNIFVT